MDGFEPASVAYHTNRSSNTAMDRVAHTCELLYMLFCNFVFVSIKKNAVFTHVVSGQPF